MLVKVVWQCLRLSFCKRTHELQHSERSKASDFNSIDQKIDYQELYLKPFNIGLPGVFTNTHETELLLQGTYVQKSISTFSRTLIAVSLPPAFSKSWGDISEGRAHTSTYKALILSADCQVWSRNGPNDPWTPLAQEPLTCIRKALLRVASIDKN